MSYRDIQTGIGLGSSALGFIEAIPGLGQIASLLSDVVGAFGLASEQQAYNDMLNAYYAKPVALGGGYNPGTRAHSYRSMKRRQARMFFNRMR